MTSEACSICGEEVDADEIDPHGHFGEDDGSTPGEFSGDPGEAEADLRRASDALSRAEDELAEAEASAEAIEEEPFDGSPEAEANMSSRMQVADREIESRRTEVEEAEGELGRTQDHWVQQGYLPS